MLPGEASRSSVNLIYSPNLVEGVLFRSSSERSSRKWQCADLTRLCRGREPFGTGILHLPTGANRGASYNG
jgi:hypothetical protein